MYKKIRAFFVTLNDSLIQFDRLFAFVIVSAL